jgi:putative transposase
MRNKSGKRRIKAQLREAEHHQPRLTRVWPGGGGVWAVDFVHDQLLDGRKIRVLTIVDTFTRLLPAIYERQHFRGCEFRRPERVITEIGCPTTIRLDKRPEFISKDLELWAFIRGVTLNFSRPSNAFIVGRPAISTPESPDEAPFSAARGSIFYLPIS